MYINLVHILNTNIFSNMHESTIYLWTLYSVQIHVPCTYCTFVHAYEDGVWELAMIYGSFSFWALLSRWYLATVMYLHCFRTQVSLSLSHLILFVYLSHLIPICLSLICSSFSPQPNWTSLSPHSLFYLLQLFFIFSHLIKMYLSFSSHPICLSFSPHPYFSAFVTSS